METFVVSEYSISSKWFKSYYVVWKLDPPDAEKKEEYSLNRTMQYGNKLGAQKNHGSNGFKSYYVVWKQFLRRKVLQFLRQFKSYYVVWKPVAFPIAAFFLSCLNRTMQYGNVFG